MGRISIDKFMKVGIVLSEDEARECPCFSIEGMNEKGVWQAATIRNVAQHDVEYVIREEKITVNTEWSAMFNMKTREQE